MHLRLAYWLVVSKKVTTTSRDWLHVEALQRQMTSFFGFNFAEALGKKWQEH